VRRQSGATTALWISAVGGTSSLLRLTNSGVALRLPPGCRDIRGAGRHISRSPSRRRDVSPVHGANPRPHAVGARSQEPALRSLCRLSAISGRSSLSTQRGRARGRTTNQAASRPQVTFEVRIRRLPMNRMDALRESLTWSRIHQWISLGIDPPASGDHRHWRICFLFSPSSRPPRALRSPCSQPHPTGSIRRL
jgi:hypothetical protein